MDPFNESDLSEIHIFSESTLIRNISIDSLDYNFELVEIILNEPTIKVNDNMEIPKLMRITQSIPYIITHGIDSYIEEYFNSYTKSEKETLYNTFIQDDNKLKAHISYLSNFK